MKIALGSDHAGFEAKTSLIQRLKSAGHVVVDRGTQGSSSVDYPDYAAAVGKAVSTGQAEVGVLICGTGIGMCIAANKVPGIRAAVVWSEETARLAAEHNKANILCLSGRLFTDEDRWSFVSTWLKTPFGGGRHDNRVLKITELDKKSTGASCGS